MPAFILPPLPSRPAAAARARTTVPPTASAGATPLPRGDALRLALAAAVHAQDFPRAARLRDALEGSAVLAAAAAAKPRFAPGVVVRSTGPAVFRAVVVGVAGGGRGAGAVEYRVAVDVRDWGRAGMRGGNVRLVSEERLEAVRAPARGAAAAGAAVAAAAEEAAVRHPVVGSYFGEDVRVSQDGFLFYCRDAPEAPRRGRGE